MSDDTATSDQAEPSGGPLAGQRLAEARKAREISIFDIARELHLDEYKVQALEENRFDILGAPVFAKGHLRKYAGLVGVSVDDVMADYYSLNRTAGAPPVVGKPRKQARELRLTPWIVAALLLAIVGGAIYWWLGRTPATDERAVAPATPGTRLALPAAVDAGASAEGSETGPEAAMAGSNDPVDGATDASSGAEDASAAGNGNASGDETPVASTDSAPATAARPIADTADVTATNAPTASGSAVRLTMRFSGDCWTEVSDATGARLFFDLGRAGRNLNVSGEPPLRVLFGNSNNVSLTVDGRDYPITAAMRRGQTARMTINKP